MNRYSTVGNIEDEYEPGGKVLKNKLDIRSVREIDRIEYDHLLKTQEHFYKIISPNTQFNNLLISEMHRHWLGSIYTWAGKYRTVNLGKADFLWPPAYLVEKNMAEFEKDFLKPLTPCRPGTLEKVSEGIAKVHAEFLLVHPFRDGNGRIARLISSLMALQAGYPAPDFGRPGKKNKKKYIDAVKMGYMHNYRPLTKYMSEEIERSKRLSMG